MQENGVEPGRENAQKVTQISHLCRRARFLTWVDPASMVRAAFRAAVKKSEAFTSQAGR